MARRRACCARAGRSAPAGRPRGRPRGARVAQRPRATDVFPTIDGEAFVEALSRSVGVGRPGPQRVAVLATAFDVLGGMATLNFYGEGVGRRLAIVLTDGETLPVDEEGLEGTLAGAAPVEFLFVRVWGPEERIFGPGGLVEDAYRPDPAAGPRFERFASAFGAELYEEDELGAVSRRAREIVGEGPTRQEGRVVQECPWRPMRRSAPSCLWSSSWSGEISPEGIGRTTSDRVISLPIYPLERRGCSRVVWLRSVRRLTLLWACVLGSLFLAGCNIGGDDSEGLSSEQSDAIEETIGVADEANWATFGYTYDQNRHVPFDEITKENVADLGKVWSVDFNKIDKDVPLGQQTFPIVVGGTMYASTHFNHIFAMDAKTGAVKWHFKPSKIGAFKNFGLTTNRGVAYCNDKVYMLTLDMRIISVNANNGQLAKEIQISRDVPDARPEFGYYETVAPVCYKNKLIIGSSGADNGVRGFVMAYNADDLSPAWANPYWTVPPEGQDWRANGRFHGGGTSWMPASIDVETDTMYFSTANPSPDFFAALRPGNNPKVNSVIALDVNDGTEKWWRQQVQIDEWDYDTAQAPQLINGTVGGEDRKVISVASKEGTWFLYDAETGDPIYEKVKLLDRIEHPPLKPGEPVDIFPSALGGINYSPALYDPTTNYVINTAVESKSTLIRRRPRRTSIATASAATSTRARLTASGRRRKAGTTTAACPRSTWRRASSPGR